MITESSLDKSFPEPWLLTDDFPARIRWDHIVMEVASILFTRYNRLLFKYGFP